ncbi:hypothetical protein AMTR_s00046p00085850 [Amborella trichopoda]|uniref:Uncharacterized protein n=1 Tax=Amborella trichopoda TaxID=13333 RepID=U5D957_AMBTC|nr:hypothetical protein AMTR_s00046p00085850 [Amborella trichopoda]
MAPSHVCSGISLPPPYDTYSHLIKPPQPLLPCAPSPPTLSIFGVVHCNSPPQVPHRPSIFQSPCPHLIHGRMDPALKAKLSSALVGSFNPRRDDVRRIERWGQKLCGISDLCYRKRTIGRILSIFPSAHSANTALNNTSSTFCGAALSLSPWLQEFGAFRS